MKQFYTNQDLSCAGTILACKSHTCKVTGLPLYSEEFITWAKDVMRVFALEAWRLVRIGVQSLKDAYRQLKSQGGATLARVVAYIPEGITGKGLRKLTTTRRTNLVKVLVG